MWVRIRHLVRQDDRPGAMRSGGVENTCKCIGLSTPAMSFNVSSSNSNCRCRRGARFDQRHEFVSRRRAEKPHPRVLAVGEHDNRRRLVDAVSCAIVESRTKFFSTTVILSLSRASSSSTCFATAPLSDPPMVCVNSTRLTGLSIGGEMLLEYLFVLSRQEGHEELSH